MKTTFIRSNKNIQIDGDLQNRHFKGELSHLNSEELNSINQLVVEADILEWSPPFFKILWDGKICSGSFYRSKNSIEIHLPTGNYSLSLPSPKKRGGTDSHSEGTLEAPMPGKIIKTFVQSGDEVKKGDLIMVLEAMKMEHKIVSPKDGKVQKIFFKEGDRVGQGEELVALI